jgi:hypothetical protein
MGSAIQKRTLFFIIAVLLLCYSVQVTSGVLLGIVGKIIKTIGDVNEASGCKLCYVPCKAGCKKLLKKSSSNYDACVKVCEKTCKCEL